MTKATTYKLHHNNTKRKEGLKGKRMKDLEASMEGLKCKKKP